MWHSFPMTVSLFPAAVGVSSASVQPGYAQRFPERPQSRLRVWTVMDALRLLRVRRPRPTERSRLTRAGRSGSAPSVRAGAIATGCSDDQGKNAASVTRREPNCERPETYFAREASITLVIAFASQPSRAALSLRRHLDHAGGQRRMSASRRERSSACGSASRFGIAGRRRGRLSLRVDGGAPIWRSLGRGGNANRRR